MADEGETGTLKIDRFEKGDKERTARRAEVMNEIIDRLNSLLALEVTPPEAGRFILAEANAKLEINAAAQFPDPDDTEKTYVWFAEFIDPVWVLSWRETVECACNTLDGGDA